MAYSYYSSIDIKATAVGANETDFPVVLILTDSRFATVGNGGHIQNTDATGGASGSLTVPADFVVSPNSDGSSPYDFEFVAYNATTGYMELWVEITSLSSSSDTTIYFCYGDSGVTTSQEDVAGTWNAGYKGVWHLHGASATACVDSSGNGNDPSGDTQSPTYQQAAQVGYGVDFDGGDPSDRITVPHSADFAFAGDFTVEAWVNPDVLATIMYFIQHYDATTEDGFFLAQGTTEKNAWVFAVFVASSVAVCRGDGAPTGDWEYVVGTRVSDDCTLYCDGVAQVDVETLAGAIDSTDPLYFGAHRDGDEGLNGRLDELRISSVERDADWILTSHKNQLDSGPNDTFWTALATEQARNPWHYVTQQRQ